MRPVAAQRTIPTFDSAKSTPLQQSFAEWMELLSTQRSPHTVRGYLADCLTFTGALLAQRGRRPPVAGPLPLPEFLRTPGGPLVPAAAYTSAYAAIADLTLEDLHPRSCASALASLAASHQPASRRRIASAFTNFCSLLTRRGLLDANPMRHDALERPAASTSAAHPLTDAEMLRLLVTISGPDPSARMPWPARDLALAATLLSAGLTASEVCSACTGDILPAKRGRSLRVLGSGNRKRTVLLHPETDSAVRRYLTARAERVGVFGGNDPLFVRSTGEGFTTRSLRVLVQRWFTRADIPPRPGSLVHLLRHTFTASALGAGASLPDVQSALGISVPAVAQRHSPPADVNAVVAAHPVGALIAAARANS